MLDYGGQIYVPGISARLAAQSRPSIAESFQNIADGHSCRHEAQHAAQPIQPDPLSPLVAPSRTPAHHAFVYGILTPAPEDDPSHYTGTCILVL